MSPIPSQKPKNSIQCVLVFLKSDLNVASITSQLHEPFSSRFLFLPRSFLFLVTSLLLNFFSLTHSLSCSGEAKEEEEEEGKKGVLKKREHGRLVWRRILFTSKKTQSIIIQNALTVIYGTCISFGLIPACVCSFPFCSIDVVVAHRGGGVQGPSVRARGKKVSPTPPIPFFYSLPNFNLSDFFIDAAVVRRRRCTDL
jgi:hypothetical protein